MGASSKENRIMDSQSVGLGAMPNAPTIFEFRNQNELLNYFSVYINMPRNKENYNNWFKNHYQKNKEKYIEKANRHKERMKLWFEEEFKDILFCVKCGEKERCCLDFHHLNPREKDDVIAHMIKRCSKDKIRQEVAKCIVVCANCHRKIHATVA